MDQSASFLMYFKSFARTNTCILRSKYSGYFRFILVIYACGQIKF